MTRPPRPPAGGDDILPAIVAGGLTAGALDSILAFALYGRNMPLGIASGLLGQKALHGGQGTWLLGMALQFLIALLAASVYCLASRRLPFLRVHYLVCGLFYGIGVYLVMNLIVVPLSAFPFPVGPFTVAALAKGLVGHMLIIGLPISISLRLLSK